MKREVENIYPCLALLLSDFLPVVLMAMTRGKGNAEKVQAGQPPVRQSRRDLENKIDISLESLDRILFLKMNIIFFLNYYFIMELFPIIFFLLKIT